MSWRADGGELDGLLRRCIKGDTSAWGALVDQFQNLVYSIARRYGLNRDDASDVFQVTFQALYRNLDRIEDARTLPKWLSVTASRESLRVKRIGGRATLIEDSGVDLDTLVANEET